MFLEQCYYSDVLNIAMGVSMYIGHSLLVINIFFVFVCGNQIKYVKLKKILFYVIR